MTYFVYDIETFPNIFTFCGMLDRDDAQPILFEISDRKDQKRELLGYLDYLKNLGVHMVGYNSLSFDYPILHELLNNPWTFDATKASHMAAEIINSSHGYAQNPNAIRLQDRLIPQIDLVKVNHFDNANKRTSLKSLQFAMRSKSVEDLPFDVRPLTSPEMDVLCEYNKHDVTETRAFLGKCRHLIEMRSELLETGVLSGDVLNYSDVKIGTEYLIRKIGRAKCFEKGSKPRQTFRTKVELRDVILPKISFLTDPFKAVHEWFRNQTIYIGAEEKPKLTAQLAGLEFDFGLGGVHASVKRRHYKSTDTHVIKDVDVSGMYVAVAIANGFCPAHLGTSFTEAYKGLQRDRAQYPKGTTMNAVLKLAGNGVYGNSNNAYSCFYDPQYTFSVTSNGQLQLLQLAELLSLIPGLELIQANTDGITALVPRAGESFFQIWCREWERDTGLKLEEVEYSRMWIRDVNNYMAETAAGKVKRKGIYAYPSRDADYEGFWNKDYSRMCVPKAVDLCHRYGALVSDALRVVSNPFDFMLRYKAIGQSKVFIGDKPQLRTTRYYISLTGEKMWKRSPPAGRVGDFKRKNKITDAEFKRVSNEIGPGVWDARIHTANKGKYADRIDSIESGYLVRACNRIEDFNWDDVDFSYYEAEIEKLVIK